MGPMYLLDTNVISELRRPRPHGAVVTWLEEVADHGLHLSAVTLGELQAGGEITREQDPGKAAQIGPTGVRPLRALTTVPYRGLT